MIITGITHILGSFSHSQIYHMHSIMFAIVLLPVKDLLLISLHPFLILFIIDSEMIFQDTDLGKVSKKLVEFSTKREGGVRIGRFSTKKNIGSKYWKWPKMHFKTNLFFSIFGGSGLFHHN